MLDYLDEQIAKGNAKMNLGEIMFSKYKISKQKAEESYLKYGATTEQEKIESILRDNKDPDECINMLLNGYAKMDEIKKYYDTIKLELNSSHTDEAFKTTNYGSTMFYVKCIAYYNSDSKK